MNGHCGVYCQSCVLKGIFYISSSRCLFTWTLFVLIWLDSTYMFGKHAIRRHFQRYPADQRRWRIQKKTHGRSGFVSGKQFWRKQRQVVTSRCHSSNISGFQHTMVLQKREKLTCMTFLCVIAHQEQNEAHTFLPSFDNSDGRLCQERLRSRNRATLVTWRHTFVYWAKKKELEKKELKMTTAQVVETSCHCQQQHSYSGLRSPERSNSIYFWNDSWVQTFHIVGTVKHADVIAGLLQ